VKILSEEIGPKEGNLQKGEEIPVPLYFDRYVASELRALGQQIVALKESMDERFVQFEKRIDEHFVQVDRRFTEVDRRFTEVDRQFVELKESFDKRFDKSEANIKWVIGLFFPIIAGILALIVKAFF
jgi:hypothetical protein